MLCLYFLLESLWLDSDLMVFGATHKVVPLPCARSTSQIPLFYTVIKVLPFGPWLYGLLIVRTGYNLDDFQAWEYLTSSSRQSLPRVPRLLLNS